VPQVVGAYPPEGLPQEEEARRKARVAEIEAAAEAEAKKIREAGKVLRSLAQLEPDQAERLRGRLERVRPPPVAS